ncbi:MAG: methyltransferase domain-containing protein [Rickettsiales bacterium]|nr:methyltransferase domain-containing protein [Rickettsiales bacterium]
MTALQIDPQALILKSMQIGMELFKKERFSEAAECFDNIVNQIPDMFQAYFMAGLSYNKLDNINAASERLEAALKLQPEHEAARNALANIYFRNLQYDNAEPHFKALLMNNEQHHEAHHRLSVIYFQTEDFEKSVAHIAKALELKPDERAYWVATLNIFDHYQPIISHETITKIVTKHLDEIDITPIRELEQIRNLMILEHKPFGNFPKSILNPETTSLSERDEIWDNEQLYKYFDSELLNKLLITQFVTVDLLEFYLTGLRRYLVKHHKNLNDLISQQPMLEEVVYSLAIQCWHNDFAFIKADDEDIYLQDCIQFAKSSADKNEKMRLYALIGMYLPLHSVPESDDIAAMAKSINNNLFDLLVSLQIYGPKKELDIIPTIPCLKPLKDTVSLKVADQYKEHPYPRWQKMKHVNTRSFDSVLKSMHPKLRQYETLTPNRKLSWLIAGTGTGQHALYTYHRYENHMVKAIDISLTSLAYAIRKTDELGIKDLEYMQADILDIADLDESFDVIESAGVLHHMADPLQGWKCLTDILRPGGYMAISLYSELARQQIVKARELIETLGFQSDSDSIRNFRKYVMDLPYDTPLRNVMHFNDFYNISECRDLLFHVQEHRFTIPQIQECTRLLGLEFVGFNINNPKTMSAFQAQFGKSTSALDNLSNWHIFEQEHPDTFGSMYHMWFKKPGTLQ